MSDNRFYVYGHYTLDTNELFYIGKGSGRRAHQIGQKRNLFWVNIVKKHGFRSEILIDQLDEAGAFIQEILAIKEFNPRANLTKGGEGTSGLTPWNKGLAPSTCVKIKISKTLKGRKRDPESTKKQMNTRKEKGIKPPTLGKKYGGAHKEKKKQELLLRISQGKHPSLGIKHSEESKINMAIAHGAKPFKVFNIDGDVVGEWVSQSQCARDLGIERRGIVRCLHGRSKTYKKLIFKFRVL